jgi:hypothetical protein
VLYEEAEPGQRDDGAAVLSVLEQNDWNLGRTARSLGLSPIGLKLLLRKYGFEKSKRASRRRGNGSRSVLVAD